MNFLVPKYPFVVSSKKNEHGEDRIEFHCGSLAVKDLRLKLNSLALAIVLICKSNVSTVDRIGSE